MSAPHDHTLVFGQAINNVTVFNPELQHDVAVSGTEGLKEFGVTNGFTNPYVVGAYGLSDFDEVALYYELERIGTNRIMALEGIALYQETENALQTLLNADISAQLTEDYLFYDGVMDVNDEFQWKSPRDLSISIGFKGIHKSGYDFGLFKNHVFNDKVGAGAAGYSYRNWSMMFPVGMLMNKNSGTEQPTVGYEYKALNGYSREMVIADISGIGVAGTGGYRPVAVNQFDIHKTGMVSEIATHNTCGNHIVIQRPQ